MPIPVPPGAYSGAFRVCCLRGVRAFLRGKAVDYAFESSTSSKCNYCTKQKELCTPVPDYAGPEFEVFLVALRAWEESDGDAEQSDLLKNLKDTARAVSDVVQVTKATHKGMTTADISLASHHSLARLGRGLRNVEAAVNKLGRSAAAPAPRSKKASKDNDTVTDDFDFDDGEEDEDEE